MDQNHALHTALKIKVCDCISSLEFLLISPKCGPANYLGKAIIRERWQKLDVKHMNSKQVPHTDRD